MLATPPGSRAHRASFLGCGLTALSSTQVVAKSGSWHRYRPVIARPLVSVVFLSNTYAALASGHSDWATRPYLITLLGFCDEFQHLLSAVEWEPWTPPVWGGACRSLMGHLAALHRPALREALLPRGRMAKSEQQAIVGCPGLTPLDPLERLDNCAVRSSLRSTAGYG